MDTQGNLTLERHPIMKFLIEDDSQPVDDSFSADFSGPDSPLDSPYNEHRKRDQS